MKYSEEFKKLVETNVYIGNGNPNSNILVLGKEVATDMNDKDILEQGNTYNFHNNACDWKKNIEINKKQKEVEKWDINDPNKINNPLYAFRGSLIKKEGQTWRKYQKLHNFVFGKEYFPKEKDNHNFQERFFISEMSEILSKTSNNAQRNKEFKLKLEERKKTFLESDFIQSFPIVILACRNYIWNYGEGDSRQILNIFGTDFISLYETKTIKKPQKYHVHKYIHLSGRKPKLVIHTNQLSGSVASNELLENIANEISNFANENNIDFRE